MVCSESIPLYMKPEFICPFNSIVNLLGSILFIYFILFYFIPLRYLVYKVF